MITRPLLRYFGGKFRLREWIISHFPAHRVYTEVFGGAASVLLGKTRSKVEVYNDIDQDLFNLFRVLRDRGSELKSMLELTPYSRDEYLLSSESCECEIEKARRFMVRSWFSVAAGQFSGLRAYTGTGRDCPVHEWTRYTALTQTFTERLAGVIIENDDAAAVLLRNDYEDSLHYVDPPYVPETRSSGGYSHEMITDQHVSLAKVLNQLKGMVVLSGYDCKLYNELFNGWHRVDKITHADSRAERIESLWLNPAAQERQPQQDLFKAA